MQLPEEFPLAEKSGAVDFEIIYSSVNANAEVLVYSCLEASPISLDQNYEAGDTDRKIASRKEKWTIVENPLNLIKTSKSKKNTIARNYIH